MRNIKKALSAFTLLILIASIVGLQAGSIPAFAGAVVDSATGIIFEASTGTVIGYTSNQADLIIPGKINGINVTKIGDDAFYNCRSLKKVIIPKGVTSIGTESFSFCTALNSVTIPDSVAKIGANAFEYCSSLTAVLIPNSVTGIGYNAFYNCTALTYVTVPGSILNFSYSFGNCTSLSSATIQIGATRIYDNEFMGCSTLTSISLPDGVTSIGNSAFLGCASLKSIVLPGSVTSIGSNAFANCTSLKSATVPSSVTSFGSDAFSGCRKLTVYCSSGSVVQKYASSNSISIKDASLRTLSGIVLKSEPSTKTYNQGQSLDLSGAVLTASYTDGTIEDISLASYMVGGFDMNKAGSQTVIVSYGGKTAAFQITVTAGSGSGSSPLAISVSEIVMKSLPTKTNYSIGQNPDLTGAVITVKNNDGSFYDMAVTPSMISGYNSNIAGTQAITVTYSGKTTSFKVTVTSSLPVVSGVKNNGYYSNDVKITFSDGTATLNNTVISNNTTVKKAGNYTLVVTNSFGVTKVLFTIDKTPPTISASVNNGGYTSFNVNVLCRDDNLNTKSAIKNGAAIQWPSNNTFTSDGSYLIVATDKAGIKTTFQFKIDKLPPLISVIKTNKKGVANNGFSNTDVKINVNDTFLIGRAIIFNKKAVTWPSNNTFSKEGKYVVTAKDRYNRTTTFTFIIDKTAPAIAVKNSSEKAISNGGSSKGWAKFTCSDAYILSKTITLNGKIIKWPSSNKVSAKGTYTITVADKAGNTKSFTFKIV